MEKREERIMLIESLSSSSSEDSWAEMLTNVETCMDKVQSNILNKKLPTRQELKQAHILYRKGNKINREIFDALLNMICNVIKEEESRYIKKVWPAYEIYSDEVIFVAMCSEHVTFSANYIIKAIIIGSCCNEAKEVMYHQDYEHTQFSREEEKLIANIIDVHAERLMSKHKNITMISGSLFKSKSYGTKHASIKRRTCIVIYVNTKGLIPIHDEKLPSYLKVRNDNIDIQVDVRESGYNFYHGAQEYHEDLKQGCMIRGKHFGSTLGGFFEKGGNTYALTTAHTFLKDSFDFKSRLGVDMYYMFKSGIEEEVNVYQNEVKEEHKIGYIDHAVIDHGDCQRPGVDVAAIKLTNTVRFPVSGEFPENNKKNAGFPIDEPMMYSSGRVYDHQTFYEQAKKNNREVYKFGSETTFTKGCIEFSDTVISAVDYSEMLEDFRLTLYKQYEVRSVGDPAVTPFAAHGDSGALVFAKHDGNGSDLRVVGIVEGGTDHGTYIVTPIWAILDRLNINDYRLKCFQDYTENALRSEMETSGPTVGDEGDPNIVQELAKHVNELRQEIKDSERQMTEKLNVLERQTNQSQSKLDLILDLLSANNSNQ